MSNWLGARWALAPALVVLSVACGGSDAGPGGRGVTMPGLEGETPAPPPAPKPDNAHALAQAISGGKVNALLHIDRMRSHPVGPKIAALGAWDELFEGTGIDPMRDFDTAFGTSSKTNEEAHSIMVGEHHLPLEKVRAAIDHLVNKSTPPGTWRSDLGVPVAEVTVRGRKRFVALPTDNLLIVLTEQHASQAAGFAQSGGLPSPAGPETMTASALQPSETLRIPRMPKIPDTVKEGRALVTLEGDGGATIVLSGESVTPEQAKKDAETLTKKIEKATSVKLGPIKVRLFKAVTFKPSGSGFAATIKLSKGELDQLLSLAATAIPK